MTRLQTQAAYARHRKVSRAYVNKLVKAGLIVMRGKLVDSLASDAVLDNVSEPTSERVISGTDGSSSTYSQAKTADMVYRAKLRKVEYDKMLGELLPRSDVLQHWATRFSTIRDRILILPDRIGARLQNVTEAEARIVLREELEECLRAIHSDAG